MVSILLVIVYAIVLEEHGFGAWIAVCMSDIVDAFLSFTQQSVLQYD